jgi:hypothetical protein
MLYVIASQGCAALSLGYRMLHLRCCSFPATTELASVQRMIDKLQGEPRADPFFCALRPPPLAADATRKSQKNGEG